MNNKLKLYLDFDCTIVDTIGCVVKLYNEDFKYYSDFKAIDPDNVYTWDFKECNCATKEYIDLYFNHPRFFENLMFIDNWTKSAIDHLAQYYDITIVSHGYSPNLRAKEEWIRNNLPMVKFIGVNLKKNPDKSCVDMSNGVFIDDGANNLKTSNAEYKICFGKKYPWNKDWNGKRIDDWYKLYRDLIAYAEYKISESEVNNE